MASSSDLCADLEDVGLLGRETFWEGNGEGVVVLFMGACVACCPVVEDVRLERSGDVGLIVDLRLLDCRC